MKTTTAVAAVFILLLCFPQSALAQGADSTSRELQELKEEIRRLREEQEATRKDVQEIKRLLQQAMAGPPVPAQPEFVSTDDDPAQGSAEARVVLIDFSDYQ